MDTKTDKNRINKLIEFFKTLKHKKPDTGKTDYASYDQTEDEYQAQQARWLEKVKNKKRKRSEK